MARKIKVSRKNIKRPDEFLTLSDRVFKYIAENKNLAYGVAGGIILAVVAINLAVYSLKTRQARADVLLTEAFSILKTPLTAQMTQDQLLKGVKSFGSNVDRNKEAVVKLSEVVKKFGSSEPGLEARYHLGMVYYNTRDYKQSISSLEAFIKQLKGREGGSSEYLEQSANLGIAKSHFELEDYAKADEYFQKVLAASKTETPYKAEALLGDARSLIKLNKNDQAREKLMIIIATYPGSIYQELADLELANLANTKSGK